MSSMWHKTIVAQGIALLALIVLGVLPVNAQDASGVVQGQVVNQSQGGGNTSQLNVTLNTYLAANHPGNTTTWLYMGNATATTDDQGRFEFPGLGTGTNYTYQLELVYQEAHYYFDPFRLDTETSVKTTTLAVYDSTSSEQPIKISRAHMIVNVTPQSLDVTEYYVIVNSGNKTYVGSSEVSPGIRETLRFSLPPQAVNLDYGGSLDPYFIVNWGNGFSDTAILAPGSKEILFSYNLDYTSDSYQIPLTLHYPVDSFDLLVQGDHQVGVSCSQLTASELPNTQGTQITYYTGTNLKRNTTLDISLSELLASSKGTQWVVIIPSVLAFGLLVGFVIWRVNRSRQSTSLESDVIIDDEEILLREIAQLDDKFEKGDISEDKYQRLRRDKKERLVDLRQRRES